jgi:hypothetical protein
MRYTSLSALQEVLFSGSPKQRPEILKGVAFYAEETHQKEPGNHCLFISKIFFSRLPEPLSEGIG